MSNYNENVEKKLFDMIKKKEETDKKLLVIEIIMGTATIIMFLVLVMIASYEEMKDSVRLVITLSSTIFVVIVCFLLLKIEQIAGYYECQKCKNRYVPTYREVLFAMHIGRTRYMKCPKCNKKSWQKKVISKE